VNQKRGGLGGADLPKERVIFHLDDGSSVDGRITIPRRGMRMSDFLAGSDREFINVEGATLTLPDASSEYSPFVMVARKSIRLIKPGLRDENEAVGDMAAWQATPAQGHPIIEEGDEQPAARPISRPPPSSKPTRLEDDPARAGSGIYPPSEPARHVNRPPSGVHAVPDDLRDKKKPS
jgi:hypothetical protein